MTDEIETAFPFCDQETLHYFPMGGATPTDVRGTVRWHQSGTGGGGGRGRVAAEVYVASDDLSGVIPQRDAIELTHPTFGVVRCLVVGQLDSDPAVRRLLAVL